ncbi:MAG TPA: hypothetical protein VE861_10910, partial [Gemmatimonadaceae bacterium]|nr:hypothetical protein [Gemmatimonadaceae bacterium]
LPIGRRFAYDEAAGRVWVICAECGRWNLVPFESRWSAIEEAEKTYRATPLRADTGEVGLARTREGSDLVRIGRPPVPELASWRYGRHFTRRRWQYVATTLPLSVAFGTFSQPQILLDIANLRMSGAWQFVPLVGLGLLTAELKARFLTFRTLATLAMPEGNAALSRGILPHVMMSPDPDGTLRLWVPVVPRRIEEHRWFGMLGQVPRRIARGMWRGDLHESMTALAETHYTAVTGQDAIAALRTVLPIMNESGASGKSLDESLAYLQRHDADPAHIAFGGKRAWELAETTSLLSFHRERRLALEMAVHTDSERRWLEGEMASLLDEWRRASEIASIADALLRDPAIEARLDALRGDARAPDSDASP